MQNYITTTLQKGIDLKKAIVADAEMLQEIERIGNLLVECFNNGNKLLICGNGGSASDAQHIASEFVGRFVEERRGLPAIALTVDSSALTAIGNDYGFERLFARQVEALAKPGDLLIGISTSGNSKNVFSALKVAQSMGVKTIGFLGGLDGGICRTHCDHTLLVPCQETARVQELHITLGHILCGLVDAKMVGNE